MQFQLVLQFPGQYIADFDALIELEDALIITLDDAHLVDGHDFGSEEMNIFILTDDPRAAFEKAYAVVAPELRSALRAAFRRLEAEEYEWLHPANAEWEFRVT